ncbi:SURP and G-patch domain-containing protein 2-like isoform 1-T2 [Discoglossus pictus]
MAAPRITRKTFDAVVQEKMKRHRISLDEAVSDTIQQLHLEGPSRIPSDHFEPDCRERERFYRDVPRDFPRDPMSRSLEMDPRRDDLLRQTYRDYRRADPFLERLRAEDALTKERDEIAMLDARIRELDNLREQRNLHPRDIDYIRSRQWESDHNLMHAPDFDRDSLMNYRELRPPVAPMESFEEQREFAGPMRDMLRAPGARGKILHPQTRGGKGQRGGRFRSDKDKSPARLHGIAEESVKDSGKPGDPIPEKQTITIRFPDDNTPLSKFGMQLVRWAKFNVIDEDLEKQHKALFRGSTETCKRIVECFKGTMSNAHRERCFSAVKFLCHPALKSPKIDIMLLDLLIEKQTIKQKNDFFEVIKPFDKEMMTVQQYLLKSAIPLLMACNTYELKRSILTNQRQLDNALKSTVHLCRKSIVLLGQTFAMASSARQNKVLDVIGLSDLGLKPSYYPNMDDGFLFGNDYLTQLKTWLKKTGVKPVLKSRSSTADKTDKETLSKVESKEKKAADPNAVAAIDKLLESTIKADKTDEPKSPFWFFFDVESNEYKYYRQKLADYQKSTGHTCEGSTQIRKPKFSPEASSETVRAMIYARKALGVKRRIFRSLAYSRKAKRRRSGTQPPVVANVKPKEELPISGTGTVKDEKSADPPSTATNSEPQTSTTLCSPKPLASVKCEPSLDPEYSDVEDKTKDTAVKLAEFVAQMGPEIEQFSMENRSNHPEFWFLHEKNSRAYSFYQRKVQEFQRAATKTAEEEDCDGGEIEEKDDDQLLEEFNSTEMAAESDATESTAGEHSSSSTFIQIPTPTQPPMPRKRVAKLKVGMLAPKRVCLVEEPNVHDPVCIEYERPRGRGTNKRKKPVDLEFANKKLTKQNVGFQMLNRMGWKEGQGLGSSGSGIKNPIKVVSVSAGEGLGMEEREAAESSEDNFDAFRQRMIKMYRQKITK